MGNLTDLMTQAKRAATLRGHKIIDWVIDSNGAHTTCAMCGKDVVVTVDHSPNDIEVRGEMIATHCEGIT
jgi:hypothetical protein